MPVVAAKEPSGQLRGPAAPCSQKPRKPGVELEGRPQVRQPTAPRSGWKVPAAHSEHSARPEAAAYEPGRHASGAVAPIEQKWPGGQEIHSPVAAS